MMSALINLPTSLARIVVKYDKDDRGRSGTIGKLVKKLSKSQNIVKESKSFKGLKNLQKLLV